MGLATRYDPTILNFVLVDYKGGGAFKPFEQLPHVVDELAKRYPSGLGAKAMEARSAGSTTVERGRPVAITAGSSVLNTR